MACAVTLSLALAASAQAAAASRPRAYIDVFDDEEFVLVVDKKIIEHSWYGFFDAVEDFKSDPQAYEHMKAYNHATNMAWGVSLTSLFLASGALVAANNDSAHALPLLNIGFAILAVGMVWPLNETIDAQYEFIKGINQFNGVYSARHGRPQASHWRIGLGSLAYVF